VSWLDLLQECAAGEIGPLEFQSTGALLSVERGQRILVFTFGQGWHALQDDSYETDFGLKVALNSLDADKIRSVDAKTIDERTLNIRRQSSRSSAIETFGLDIARDLVRAVTGVPINLALAKRVTGADALSFSAELEMEDLGTKCDQLLEEYAKETYKERFAWIDKLKPVKDKSTQDELNLCLLKDFENRKGENIYLAPPGIADWDRVHYFYFIANQKRHTDDKRTDLDIDDYWSYFTKKDEFAIEIIKQRDKVVMIVGDDEIESTIPLYKCIVFEVQHKSSTFILSEGHWFKIDRDFVKETDENLLKIKDAGLNLPNAEQDEREEDYNSRVARERGYLLLDRQNIPVTGRGKIEFCDLLTKNLQVIHVKKHKSSSSTLSHLFAQGRVSAITFLENRDFRRRLRDVVKKLDSESAKIIPIDRPDPSQYEVVYAIISGITDKQWQLKLPFFSRLNLVETAKDLRRSGYNVKIIRVHRC
jgi:uncharacterized protein (TIGR04141 family)